MAAIDLPDGFAAFAVADGLEMPTSLAVGPGGSVYVSQFAGPVFRLVDADGDGVFEDKVEYATDLVLINGIAFAPDGALYVSTAGSVTIIRDTDGDGASDEREEIITGLPVGAHWNNGLAFGPDGLLYITNGSTCNECTEVDPQSATILRANPDGSDLQVFATGLRNSYDLTFDAKGRLWATDNGSDPPCNTIDELNLVLEGRDYGWPYEPGCDSFGAGGTPPIASLNFNTASTGIDEYDGAHFPPEYVGSLFMTLWGSNALAPVPAGRVLVRAIITDTAEGPLATIEEFATGFDNPIDVVVDSDGTLLVLDFGSGRLYRIGFSPSSRAHAGQQFARQTARPSADGP